ncbi:hypothetical protein C2S52_005216 [Perilla frutescens var. hirtella]|nr:hypothetical protein C2S52_005216 [Perilla frutescens var. hirtella]
MAEAAVTFLLEQLKEVVIGYKDLISGAENEFKQLNDDLDLLKAFLKETAKNTKKDVLLREWERRIRNAVYEVEDTIDTCLTNAIQLQAKTSLRRRLGVGGNRLSLAKEKIAYGAGSGEDSSQTKSERDIPIRQNRVVGFDGEEATIMGDVFLQIMRKFTPSQDPSNLNDDELAQTVCACLEKKFLLVLDDVWSVDAWTKIKQVLPLSNGEGKVLITTRQMDVGMQSRVYRNPHELCFLSDNESWTLLQYEVFGNLEDCPRDLRGIGYRIAIKCDGVPLTIVVIGGILADQRMKSPSTSVSEWGTVANNVSLALQGDKAQRITNVVALSYNRLPDDMRECFVFLGVFPEDYEIPAKMLCGMWISEGFILPKKGRSVEESAEDNMNDLICRNLLKVDKANHMGKVKTCRVHDMIRAFCIAKSDEENLFQEITKSKTTGALEPSLSEIQKSHRLCFRSDLSRFLSGNPSAPHVRSFMCFYDQPVELEPQYISVIPDGFSKLRILESKCIKFNQFPGKVTKLIHLRYLTLRIDNLKILPGEISQLWNLQSLVVETKSRSITMKANIWKMIRLRYLKTRAAIDLDSKWEGDAGENLHTLNRLSPKSCTEAVAKKAKNLKTLGISGLLADILERKFLEKLHHLEKLKLVNSSTYEPTSEDMMRPPPQSNCFPPHIKRLTLTNTFIGWQHMSTLATIKTLEALKLKDNAFVGVSWSLGPNTFPNLLLLLIVNTDLVLWEASADSFPKLKFLVVKICENLKEIPECLGTHLEKLDIERLRPSAVQSAQKIEKTKETPKGKFAVQFNLNIGPACLTK